VEKNDILLLLLLCVGAGGVSRTIRLSRTMVLYEGTVWVDMTSGVPRKGGVVYAKQVVYVCVSSCPTTPTTPIST
jgi:hypothetical protein